MRAQPGSFVRLNADYPIDNSKYPIWGGRQGMIGGLVIKAMTHHHDKEKHEAQIDWMNKEVSCVPDRYLEFLSESEREYSAKFFSRKGLADHDVFVLVRTASGKMILNYIESAGSGEESYTPPASKAKYFVGLTKYALLDLDRADEVLLNHAVAFPDWTEVGCDNLYEAQCQVYKNWDIPIPTSFYHPLPEFKTIGDACKASPSKVGSAISMFRLPRNVCEYLTLGTAPLNPV